VPVSARTATPHPNPPPQAGEGIGPWCLHPLFLTTTLLCACAPANSLNGSMKDLTSLGYTGVAVKLQGSSLVIEYQSFIDGGGNIPFELTYNTNGIPLDAGMTLLLDAGTPSGSPRALASRTVVGDNRTFSPIQLGTLTLDGPVAVDAKASGSFFAAFTYQTDGSLGSGRTVYGDFDVAKVTP
jgi:hypothetical protein